MRRHWSLYSVRRHSVLVLATAVAFAFVCMLYPSVANADGPGLSSTVPGLLSRTNYRAVPVGSLLDGYWNKHVNAPDQIRYVEDPLGERGTVQRVEVRPGDLLSGGERADVLNQSKLGGFRDGDTVVMSWGLMIDSAFASPPGTWNSFADIHTSGGGAQSPLHLSLAGDQANLLLQIFGAKEWSSSKQPNGSVYEKFDLGPLPKNRWHDFVVAVRFGCTGTGYIQLWMDQQLLVDARDRQIGYCGDPGMYWKQGFYRKAYDKTTRLWFSDTYRWCPWP